MATPQLAAQSPPEILSPPAARRRRTPVSARFQPFAGSGGGDPPRALTRRAAAAVAGAWFLRRRDPAGAAESWFVAPEQTAAEAEAAVAGHARGLLELFPLVESRAWRELQQALREDAPLLKQDLYTIIQSKPGARRPELRKLFSALFNSVTRLDYAARSRDEASAVEHYRAIVATLETIMARI
ncbi:unnamed protein product [Spirodela intermedia]|uniref:Uncharacterized protein n=1 Tax=Spirodela intermedia TaxID=51605 RepID=A0A7I8L0E2_SPIIN|nr:unnamed protein product [Spirodela intermedia]